MRFNGACILTAGTKCLQNYDDQSVDSVPSATRDFEYTTARKAVPFYPESQNPVVEVEPVQEIFTGVHTAEVRRTEAV